MAEATAVAPHPVTAPPASAWAGRLLLAAGVVAWVTPPLVALAQVNWTTEAGALGPLVLATGLWMLAREIRRAAPMAEPGSLAITLALLVPAALIYVAALAITMVPALCIAAWVGVIALLYGLTGRAATRACWFPLLYLLLLVPLPYAISATLTAALRGWLSVHAVSLAALLGLEVAVDGNAVFVDQYELAVEAACAGLSSTISLLSVGLLYGYVLRGSGVRRVAVAIVAAIPIAILANLLRILLLLVAVHVGGADVLATPIHPLSGFVSFALAFAILAAIDHGIVALRRWAA